MRAIPYGVLGAFLPTYGSFFRITRVRLSNYPFTNFFVAIGVRVLRLRCRIRLFFVTSYVFLYLFRDGA